MLQKAIDLALTSTNVKAFQKLVSFKEEKLKAIDAVFGESAINDSLDELAMLFEKELMS